VIDIVDTLDLLEGCVRDSGPGYRPRRPSADPLTGPGWYSVGRDGGEGIVATALLRTGSPVTALSTPGFGTPVPAQGPPGWNAQTLTLGALVVLRAAAAAELQGDTWGRSLACALRATARFVDLLPDGLRGRGEEVTAVLARGVGSGPKVLSFLTPIGQLPSA